MTFFSSSEVLLSEKLLEIIYLVMGLISAGTGIYNLLDHSNKNRFGTGIFWLILGIVIGFGRWIPSVWVGVLILVMTIPAILQKVTKGKSHAASKEYMENMANKIGNRIFLPALSIGFVAIIIALFTKLGALVGVGLGVLLAIVLMMLFSKDNKPATFFKDAVEMLGTVGPLSMLPMLLASLGAVFTQAGVGEVISNGVSGIVPKGNMTVGIIIYALGMVIFTIIMGNAFAAITVMTVGIGAPFVLAYGADPALVVMVALSCGFCGTLMTPMAANFNIVPVAILEMKDKYGVIKNQIFVALFMLVFQIVYMLIFK
ncbi:DUF979 domain-containing protein [Enterococcus massiliensis]|uniref:DUF979 domain-containing protein n=1 Tax=Enterococcus massiliensis TaxID=1640685 RepID=UPI00065DF8B0|nr:DUF979 domain-containing protein [Enterococcus massiliensis]